MCLAEHTGGSLHSKSVRNHQSRECHTTETSIFTRRPSYTRTWKKSWARYQKKEASLLSHYSIKNASNESLVKNTRINLQKPYTSVPLPFKVIVREPFSLDRETSRALLNRHSARTPDGIPVFGQTNALLVFDSLRGCSSLFRDHQFPVAPPLRETLQTIEKKKKKECRLCLRSPHLSHSCCMTHPVID